MSSAAKAWLILVWVLLGLTGLGFLFAVAAKAVDPTRVGLAFLALVVVTEALSLAIVYIDDRGRD